LILTKEIQKQIIDAIEADTAAAVVLPDHAYSKEGRVLVVIDGLAIDLHRHLYTLIIGPLTDTQRMHDTSGVEGNVNPYLFTVVEGGRSPSTHCPNDHPYAGNEMPPNSRGYRCRLCYEAALQRQREQGEDVGTPNSEKTECPQRHPYSEENTLIDSAGRRRCRICKKAQARAYVERQRDLRKANP